MTLCFPASHLRYASCKAFKTANQLHSRALTINSSHNSGEPEQDYFSYNHPTFAGDEKPPNLVDWSLVSQLSQHGSLSNPYYLSKLVSFCGKSNLLAVGIQVHSTVIKGGFTSNVYISSAFVDMYAKCGLISCAQKLFDEMPERNSVTWNSLICGYANANRPLISIGLFLEMLRGAVAVTPFSISDCLVCCTQLGALELGAQVHGLILKAGLVANVVLGTCLVDMYSKCCSVADAKKVFDGMADKNVTTWTSLVTGHAQNEQPDEAMILVREMARLDVQSNYVTYNSLLSSFSRPEHLDYCKQVHCCIIREGLESNSYIAATLVTVYSKCSNNLEDFNRLCSGVRRCDQISWNAVVAGYSNLGYGEEALKCVREMMQAGIDMDFYTFTSVLGAIGHISALEEGKEMHALIFKTGYASNVHVQNGLVSMYAKCGAISDSKQVFWSMEEHDVISWNALLTGCAHHGYCREATELFEEMRRNGIKPDSTTFLAVLSACSHAGFVDKGLEYFALMRNEVSIESLKVEHYAIIVDMFGRAGRLNEAEAFIDSMPIEPGSSAYKALLSACLVHGNKDIAARLAKRLLDLCPNDPATYVLLSNVLMTESCWKDAAEVRKLMCDRNVRKKPGNSWI